MEIFLGIIVSVLFFIAPFAWIYSAVKNRNRKKEIIVLKTKMQQLTDGNQNLSLKQTENYNQEDIKALKNQITKLTTERNNLNLKITDLTDSNRFLTDKNVLLSQQNNSFQTDTIKSYRSIGNFNDKFCITEINDNLDMFIKWEVVDTNAKLIIVNTIINNVKYTIRGMFYYIHSKKPTLIHENTECCTLEIEGAYIKLKAPFKGIVTINEKNFYDNGDIVFTLDGNVEMIEEFERNAIKERILEKQRLKNMEKQVYNDLADCGLIFQERKKNEKNRESIPQDVIDRVWNRDGGKCVKCGSQEKLEFDHIIPFSKSGSTTYRNLQLLCEKCNREKSNKIG